MVAVIKSCTLLGIDAVPIDVECVMSAGQLPSFNIVGLPTASVKEGAVRVKAALLSVDHEIPMKRVTVNLAPGDLRKPGSALDLPTALSILIAEGLYDAALLDGLLVLGELGLDGSIRRVPGVLAAAMLARDKGMRGVLVPDRSAAEAMVVEDIEVYGAHHLEQVIDALTGEGDLPLPSKADARRRRKRPRVADLADVRGQHFARSALEVAVAGGHNMLLSGPPGTGKTMLARRIPSVLPAMTREESLETTKIYSSLGLADGLIEERPFRAPHHTISTAALLGGGSVPRPGEISLAHNGVLFLDELPEFQRATIEGLRQPLEERAMTIGRVNGTICMPSSFLLVAAANPCPCGWLDSDVRECTCSKFAIERYRSRLSGPLLDRIDLQVLVETVTLKVLRQEKSGESSAAVRDRVLLARERQRARFTDTPIRTNAEMTSKMLREVCRLDAESEAMLERIVTARDAMSARGINRLLKVARTIADLDGKDRITPDVLEAAACYRAVDPMADVALVVGESRKVPKSRLAQPFDAQSSLSLVVPSSSTPSSPLVVPSSSASSSPVVVPSSSAPSSPLVTPSSSAPSSPLVTPSSSAPSSPLVTPSSSSPPVSLALVDPTTVPSSSRALLDSASVPSLGLVDPMTSPSSSSPPSSRSANPTPESTVP